MGRNLPSACAECVLCIECVLLHNADFKNLSQRWDETYLVPGNSAHLDIKYHEGASNAGKYVITSNGLTQVDRNIY